MYKKGAGNDEQGKDAGNRTLCPYRNFSQAIMQDTAHIVILSQGYKVNRLRNSFQKFYGRNPDVVAKYQKSVRDMMNDSFPLLIHYAV